MQVKTLLGKWKGKERSKERGSGVERVDTA